MPVLLLLEVAKRFAKLLLTIVFFIGLAGVGAARAATISLIETESKTIMAKTGVEALFLKDDLNTKAYLTTIGKSHVDADLIVFSKDVKTIQAFKKEIIKKSRISLRLAKRKKEGRTPARRMHIAEVLCGNNIQSGDLGSEMVSLITQDTQHKIIGKLTSKNWVVLRFFTYPMSFSTLVETDRDCLIECDSIRPPPQVHFC